MASKQDLSNSYPLFADEPVSVQELEESLSVELEPNSPRKKRTRRTKVDTPVVESAVRRSPRVKASCKGFKSNTCKAKNCLGCSVKPPTLSTSALRKIGSSICQIDQELLDDQTLLKKKKMDPVGKKQKKPQAAEEGKAEEKDDEEATDSHSEED